MSRKKKQTRDYALGALLTLVGLLLLGGMVGGAWWVRSLQHEIDEATNCPRSGPKSVHVLLFDRTDPITGQQAQQIRQSVSQLADGALVGQRFDLYEVEGNSEAVLRPVLSVCSPGKGKDANELYQNPTLIEQRFKSRFEAVLNKTLNDLLKESSRPSSPIIESIRAAAITSFGGLERNGTPLFMTIFSDMVQHSSKHSHITSAPNFGELARSGAWRAVQPDLRLAEVRIFYLLRPKAARKGAPIQTRGHQAFWEELMMSANGRLVSIQPI